ncbi:MAG: IreB family regulatory phosphoprotein [Ruthenibacterium lactatiformans]
MSEPTTIFSIYDDKDKEIRAVLTEVYRALKEKGYNPINQLVGYILSEDPTYITTYQGARSLIRKIDRDDLLQALLKNYSANNLKRRPVSWLLHPN